MKCPKCSSEMKVIKVKIQDADTPVISHQCSNCGYFDFEERLINKSINEIKIKGDKLCQFNM